MPIAIVWANLHGSFVLVPLLLLVATAVDLARRRSIWPLDALLTIAAASAGLVTPWGTDTYRYIVTLTSNDVVRLVAEWQPLWTHPAAAGVVLFVVVVTVVSAIRAPATVDDVEGLVTATLLLALTVSSARSVVWWALYVPPVLGSLLARRRRGPTVRPEVARAAVAALLVVALLVCVRVVVTPAERLLDDVPFGVTRSLQERPDTARRIFDLWWGSWFEFSLHDSRVFIDTRLELFPDSIWGDYATVARADPGWEAILDEWRVSAVVIPADWGSPLMSAMRTSPRWEPMYGDEQGAVFVPKLG